MELGHLCPEGLQAERGREAGPERGEAGPGREGGGRSVPSEEVGPGQEDCPLLLGEPCGGVRPRQSRPEDGGERWDGGRQKRPGLVLGRS